MKLGFIGFGEAAYYISLGLKKQSGDIDIFAFDTMAAHADMGSVIKKRGDEAGVSLLSDISELAGTAEIIIASVPSSYTVSACESIAGYLSPNQLYADISASTPDAKKKVWEKLEPVGALFADAAVLGSIPQDGHRVPITASGNGAAALEEALTPFGMRISQAGDRPGDASAIKLVRSIFMKGLASLMTETTLAAVKYDVSEQVVKSLGKSMDGISFEDHLNRMIIGSAIHGARRAAEVCGSVSMCQEADIPCEMSQATVISHERLASYNFAAEYSLNRPESWRNVIQDIITRRN